MSLGKRVRERQPEIRVATRIPTAASHPFYTRLDQRLAENYFDDFVEGRCQPFYEALSKIKFMCSAEIVRLIGEMQLAEKHGWGNIRVSCDTYPL